MGKELNDRHKSYNRTSLIFLITILISLIFNTPLFNLSHNNFQQNSDKSDPPKSSDIPSDSDYFKYYKILTIDHSKLVQSSYINFPFLISIYDSDLHKYVQDNGYDIAFAIDNLWLDHEIEFFTKNFNTTHAKLVVWVRIPSLSGTVDTNITMYYGNSTMNSRQNPSGVWLSNYKGVWHLSETSGNALDSTSYGTSGALSGTVNRGLTGVNYNAYDFGYNGQINFGDPADGHFDMGTGSFTISFWINFDDVTGNYQLPLYKGSTTSNEAGYDFETNYAGESMSFRICDGSDLAETPFLTINYDSWMHIVGVVDRSSNYIRLFKNGMQVGSGSSCSAVDSVSNGIALRAPYNIYYLNGLLDEIRISNVQRSAGWINTEYENQKNPNSFYSVGPQQIIIKELPNSDYYTFYKTITIDHSEISGTGSLVNFPVLISIFDSDLRFALQPDGDDIAFAQDNEWLDHEIELFNQSYNSTHAQLIVWVRIPFLYTDVDTNITMYYSNSTMSSQQNPSGVWGNYIGVWHLNESPTGIVYDSTQYNNDGTTLGSMSESDLVPGQIGDGFDLDGIDDMISVSESSSLDSIKSAGTLSIWINWVDSSDGGYQRFLTTTDRFDPPNYQVDGFEWAVQPDGDLYFYPWGGGSGDYNLVTNPFTNGIWQYVVLTLDYSTKSVQMYLDGNLLSLAIEQVPSVWTQLASLDDWLWGGNDVITDSQVLGKLDEIRASSIVRSPDWIVTEYNNQYIPDNFYSISQEQKINILPSHTDYFNYYKEITTDPSKISGENSLVNFPLLISIFDSDLRYDVQSNGADIAFAQNGKWLSYEIEKFTKNYNSTHAQLVAWVRIPYLFPTEDMNITIYYGNSTMSDRQNPSQVWIADYLGVWHLREDPSGTPPQIKDSSYPSSDGSSYGVMTSTDQVSGVVGGALDFEGNDDYIDFGNPSELQITNEFTVQTWFKAEVSIDNDYLVVKSGSPGNRGWDLSFDIGAFPNGYVMFRYSPDGSNTIITGNESVTIGQWYHIVGVFKPNEYSKFFINGTEVANITTGVAPSINDPSLPVRIGRRSDSAGATSYFDGLVDEARVSNVARSNDWIKTEYNNQNDPHSFYTVGEEQFAKEVILADIQVNVRDLYGNLIPNANVSIYSNTQLIRNGFSNKSGSALFLDVPKGEYNFTVSIQSNIGILKEIINQTSEAILIDLDFETINLTCNVGTNFFEVEDVDGVPIDSGWILVGNSTHILQNCTIDALGRAKFWWVNTTPYEYNYSVYYQDVIYNPSIIKLRSGNINSPNSTLSFQVELTTVEFTVVTIASAEPVSGVKIKLNDTSGMSIVNLTTDQNGITTLRWITSLILGGNYSIQLEFFSQNMLFNNTIGGPVVVDEYNFEVLNKLSLKFRIQISLSDFQTELVSLNPSDYIEIKWGQLLKLRVLFNVTKAGGSTELLGPVFTDSMSFNILKGGTIVKTGIFLREEDNLGRHSTNINTSNLNSEEVYLITISGQKSGYLLPSNIILQLSILKNNLFLNESSNDDSTQTLYWSESADLSVSSFGETSEIFTIRDTIFQDETHNFALNLPSLENQWNLSQITFNIYNISWNVEESNINISIIDPYGKHYMFHPSNHSGYNYLLGYWEKIVIVINKLSPKQDNNFEFSIGGSFTGTVDVIADAEFIRDQVDAEYLKYNVSNSLSIISEAEGWAIKQIKFDIFNCRENGTWNEIDPLNAAHLNITTNEGFLYSLDEGFANGTGSLTITDLTIYPISGEYLFYIESTLNIMFNVIIHVEFIQEFYRSLYLEGLNSSITIHNVLNSEKIQIKVLEEGWTEQEALLKINGINNGISYFLPSELAMKITIGGHIYNINDASRGYGKFSLVGFNKDYNYSAIISTNQQVDFTLEYMLRYSRISFYKVIGTVSYSILQAPSINGIVQYDHNRGFYLQSIDTSLIDADNYDIRFTVIKDHYTSAMKDLYINVLSRPTLINGSSEFYRTYRTIYVKDDINFTFRYVDALMGNGIDNIGTFSYIWESYDDLGLLIDRGDGMLLSRSSGRYTLDFGTDSRPIGEYLLIVTIDKHNYESRNALILLSIEKRIFNYTLGDNFVGSQISVVKGKNVFIEVKVLDPTKGNIPLENATILLNLDGIGYVLEDKGNGTYTFTFSTRNVNAFFAPMVLAGIINISKEDYISQEFRITIIVDMEQVFPGIPTFYFLLILIGIISILSAVTINRVYKRARIPKFVKDVRAIQKIIEDDKKIPNNLIYREKEVYIAELMENIWHSLDLSFATIIGIEISKTQKQTKERYGGEIAKKQYAYKPLGLALMRWNERVGTEIIAKYPEDVKISEKSLMQIYGTHEYSGEKGIITLMDGSLNIVSYYTGPDQGYYLLLLLDLSDDPDLYESSMTDILQTIIQNLQDDAYLKLLPYLFQRLSEYPSYNEEQMIYYTYQNDIKRMIINYLQEYGVIAQSELSIWLKEIYKEGFADIDAAITELMKMGILKQVALKDSPSDLIFLTKDIYMLRVPPRKLLREVAKKGLPSTLVESYRLEVKNYFQEYIPSKEDNLNVIEILSLPQVYETFRLLRRSIVTLNDLEKLRKKGVDEPYNVLKVLWDNNLIKVFHDDQNIEYYALLSDFYVDYIFPKYTTRIIKKAYEQKSKENKVLVEYLRVLEDAYTTMRKKAD